VQASWPPGEETLKLESALARLRTRGRVAVLHYAPIGATVEGEPVEIYPFLGSSRLEEPINRYRPDAVFHGHAHRGRLEGATSAGVPVYNVALPLLRRSFPDQPPSGWSRSRWVSSAARRAGHVRRGGARGSAAMAAAVGRVPGRSRGLSVARAASSARPVSCARVDFRSSWAAATRSSAISASAAR
jgi:hypothetical protein